MQILLVVNNPDHWPLNVTGVEVVPAKQYLTDPCYHTRRNVRVFNLCRSYSYQSLGYYVSLLAEARGHKPIPDVVTIQDMKSVSLVRAIGDDLDRLIDKTLRQVPGEEFTLSIYFGQTIAQRDRPLGLRLFGLFRAPLIRAQFEKRDGRWELQNVRPIPSSEISEAHRPVLLSAAEDFFKRGHWNGTPTHPPRYHLAILVDPDEKLAASNGPALEKFAAAAEQRDIGVEFITRDDYPRLGEFDALFIRATTFLDHYTYRFARRAAADGLAVIDHPVSIARCTNKVYLAERLAAGRVPIPHTLTLHRDNVESVMHSIGLPIVLKQPDSAFSVGVIKAHTEQEYREKALQLLEDSDLIIAQKFIPTTFDWRIGVLDGQPLYACKYFMARNHWQIYRHHDNGQTLEGKAQTLRIEDTPRRVIHAAVKSAKLIGDGLYGVDIKQINGKVYVIEVNDNPSLDAGVEDRVLKDELYDRVIGSIVQRIERIREGVGKRGRRSQRNGVV